MTGNFKLSLDFEVSILTVLFKSSHVKYYFLKEGKQHYLIVN